MSNEGIKYKYFDVFLDESELDESIKNYLRFYTGQVSISFYSIEDKCKTISTFTGAGIFRDNFHIKTYLRFYDDGIDIKEIKNLKAKIIDVKTDPVLLEIKIITNNNFYNKYKICDEPVNE